MLLAGLLAAGVHYLVAAAAGALLGAATDFFLKKWWAFDAAQGPLAREARRYAMVSVASAGLNSGLAYLLVDSARLRPLEGLLLASVVVMAGWNYPLQRWFVFAGRRGLLSGSGSGGR